MRWHGCVIEKETPGKLLEPAGRVQLFLGFFDRFNDRSFGAMLCNLDRNEPARSSITPSLGFAHTILLVSEEALSLRHKGGGSVCVPYFLLRRMGKTRPGRATMYFLARTCQKPFVKPTIGRGSFPSGSSGNNGIACLWTW